MVFFEFDIFLLKKHFCSSCVNVLSKQKLVRIINQHTDDASKYTTIDGISAGDIKLTAYGLKYSKCNSIFTVKEQKILEKAKHK